VSHQSYDEPLASSAKPSLGPVLSEWVAECRRPAEDVTKGRLTTRRTKGLATALLFAHMTLAPTAPAALPELLTRTNQPAVVVITNGQVEYLQPLKPPKPAPIHQLIDFDEALRTLIDARATVRFFDWSWLTLADRSRLEILRDSVDTNSPAIRLLEGQFYFSSRGGPIKIPVETPSTRALTKGTEFLVRVDTQTKRTEFTMFDGEVELKNDVDTKLVRTGQQGIAVTGQPIQVLNRIEAKSIVQWWIYYPGILDPEELGLDAAEQAQLAASLTAYRAGALPDALKLYPGYPNPPEPSTEAGRIYYAGLLLSVGAVDRAEAQLQRVSSNAPPARALRTMIDAVTIDWSARFTNQNSRPNPGVGKRSAVLNKSDTSDTHRPSRMAGGGRTRLALLEEETTVNTASIPKSETQSPRSMIASEWLAISYAHQATNNLNEALVAARNATINSPEFGLGWARVAELEFSFAHIRAARIAVTNALFFTPRNAQAHALSGFLLASENRVRDAIASFDHAIKIDPALGNAWLGRGLCKRRLGWFRSSRSEEGQTEKSETATRKSQFDDWLSDLQTAAMLEPTRSLMRSYAGKAFADVGDDRLAHNELDYANTLDPKDPTPWLYSALLNREENRVNTGVSDLEKSVDLNYNRRVYRSRLLLDQDRAVRGANLARIYQDAGMNEVAVREAAQAVSYDYANHSAHQFLAESFDALRDPARFNLRYETVWFNELLLANLLSPVGAGLLSQNISQQEYTSLFEHNRLGLLTSTEVRSDGQYREIASQYGLLGRTSYTIDLDYQHNDGVRPNNDLDRIELYAQFKQQLSPRDSLFVLTKYQDYQSGDNFQHYDPADASRQLRFEERQAPIALVALHREWAPGLHTTLLSGRLHSDVDARDFAYVFDLWTNSPPPGINNVRFQNFENLRVQSEFTAYLAELNQIWQGERHVCVAGGRFQAGSFQVGNVIDDTTSTNRQNYYGLPVRTEIDEPFQRWSLYAYDTQEVWDHFRLTAGLSYDYLRYPANFRFPPVSGGQRQRDAISPKFALQWDFPPGLTVRGIYAQSIGGLSYDESVRLEPTQLAGFSQSFRSVISEAEAGSVVAPKYEVGGLALDVKLRRNTFLGLTARWMRSDVDQRIGVFNSDGSLPPPPPAIPASTTEKLRYEEGSLSLAVDQLLGTEWALGASYELARSRLRWSYPEIPVSLPLSPSRTEEAVLHRFNLRLQWQHPSGFFARSVSRWFIQDNEGYGHSIYTAARPFESVPQFDLFAGYRFWRRRGEVTLGLLNITGEDYRLNSLTPYPDLPRERVFLTRLRLNF